jgi:hypothetical protein
MPRQGRPTRPQDKLPITRRALVQRINRALEKRHPGWRLRAHGGRGDGSGRMILVDEHSGRLWHTNVNVESLGREMKVLASFERLEVFGDRRD